MIRAFQQQVRSAAGQVRQAFLGLVARGGQQQLQLEGLDGEVLQDVEVMQHVGFASWIPEDAKTVLLPIGGKTGRAVIVGSSGGAVVVELSEGETCIYDQFGHQILLDQNGVDIQGNVKIHGKLQVTADISSGANISATGDVSDSKGSMQQIRVVYNLHKHGSSPTSDSPM